MPEAAKTAIPQLLALGKPVVVVSFGSPYLLRDFPELPTYLCAWGGQDIAQVAAVQALFGETAIGGQAPDHDPRPREAGGRDREGGSSPRDVREREARKMRRRNARLCLEGNPE